MTEETTITSIGEIVREAESTYTRGTTKLSKYVNHSMYETIERIYAYLNSKHISGDTDSLGREKPFFNIVVAAANIWMRATDIDRKNIRVRGTKSKDWIDAFLATVKLQEWMRKERFGKFLNRWGRILSRYGSAVIKVVENSSGLHVTAVQWSRLIVDSVDFYGNPVIEIIELSEADLRQRVKTHGYDKGVVESLCTSFSARELTDKQKKDNKNGFIKLYEVHAVLPRKYVTNIETDTEYEQQMHVISFVNTAKNKTSKEYTDYTLYSGFEEKSPYILTHLIEEDDRTLSIGAVEYLFDTQWMQNHSVKSIKDQLDLASKIFFQTTDPQFLGANILTDADQGSIFVTEQGTSLSAVNNASHDVVSQQNFAVQWKQLGNEIVGVSEAMLGAAPKSGTAWRQTEALLDENYSLFELMTENKGFYLEDLFRDFIIPYIKKSFDTSEEVSDMLSQNDIDKIDARYIKNFSIKEANRVVKEKLLKGEDITEEEQELLVAKTQNEIKEALKELANERYFKPSDVDTKTWKDQFKDLEWNIEIDITGEQRNIQEMLTTLNTALRLVMQPGFDQNPKAKAIVGQILELTGAMSPVQYNALSDAIQPAIEAHAVPPTLPEQMTGQV